MNGVQIYWDSPERGNEVVVGWRDEFKLRYLRFLLFKFISENGIRLGAEGADPSAEVGEEPVECFLEDFAVRGQVVDRVMNRREAGMASGDPLEDVVESFVGAVATEPIVGDPFFEGIAEFRREDGGVFAERGVAGGCEIVERDVAMIVPMAGEEVVVDDVGDHPGEAPPLRCDVGLEVDRDPVGVGEAVDGPVSDDAVEDGVGKGAAQGFRPAGHEIAEQVADAGGGVVFGEQQVGEVVQCGDDRWFGKSCNLASGKGGGRDAAAK